MLSKNSVDLLFILHKREFCSIHYLTKELNVSKNTVLHLLDELGTYLDTIANSHIRILRKSGDGITLVDEYQEMNTVLLKLSKHYHLNTYEAFDGRCIQEILILINQKDYLSIQELADKVYVSKGTVINDLDLIDRILEMYHIRLARIRNRGIRIEGRESDVRKIFSDIINGKLNKAPIQILAYDNKNSLYGLFHKEIVDRVHRLIMKVINEDMELSNIQISAVLVHVMIAIQRIQNGETLRMPQENLKKIETTRYYQISKTFAEAIEQMISLKFTEDEIGYIAIHLMCSKQVLQVYDLASDEYSVIDEHLKQVVDQIVTIISEETGNRSISDRELIDGLILHLKPTIERIRNNLSTKNPYLEEIKKNYLPAFDISIRINELLDREYGIGYDENEIAYIALHVQAHMERFHQLKDERKRVAVVCSTGIGSSQLLMARLKNYFGTVVEFQAMSLLDIQKIERQSFDLILTTIPLDIPQRVLFIDPFFEDAQLDKIARLLNSSPKENLGGLQGSTVFRPSLITIMRKEMKKEEVLEFLCKKLYEEGYVTEDFWDSVCRREQIAGTAYRNFAIPHGDVNYVKKSCIYIFLHPQGIKWDQKTVNVVFLIALNKDKHTEFGQIFNDLYETVSDEKKMNQLINAKTESEVYRLMLGEM